MALPRSLRRFWSPRTRRAARTAGVKGPSLAGPIVVVDARAATAAGVRAGGTTTKPATEACRIAHEREEREKEAN